MLVRWYLLSALVLCAAVSSRADTIQLKDKAAITGKILAEKRDQLDVDIGYTVLAVPRSQVVNIIRGIKAAAVDVEAPVPAPVPPAAPSAPAPVADASPSFYSAPLTSPPAASVRDLVNRIGEAVVQVRTPEGLGSGFILNPDGFLLTNFHVIEGETEISVEVYLQKDGQLDRRTYRDVRIVALNKFQDLALLQIQDKDSPKFKFVSLGGADAMAVGERVFAIGSPLGLERTVTEGILSTKTREFNGALYLQTTAQINPGNSGGPLFNMYGEVIGITNMKIASGEGLGFAIPIEAARFFLDHRDAFAYSNDNPSNPYRYLEPPSRTRRATPTP
jgi:serine protease Do